VHCADVHGAIEGEGVGQAAVLVQGGTIEKPGIILGAAMASIR